MDLTECRLLDGERGPIDVRLSHRVDLHEQASTLSTCDVKRSVTVGLVALNRCTRVFLLAQVASQFPSCRGNVIDAFYWFQKHCVGKADFRDPDGTYHMCPAAIARLLEGATTVRTQNTVNWSLRGLEATAAQPLALWNIGYSIALLVYSQVAGVTEENNIAVEAFIIQAHAAEGVIVNSALGGRPAAGLLVRFILEPVHQQLKGIG